MATKLFLTNTTSDFGTANNDANLIGTAVGWNLRTLSTAVGAGVVNSAATATVTGATPGVEVLGSGSLPLSWNSPPLDAAVTISGSITWNIWGRESAAAANVAINGRLEKIDGATGVITVIDTTVRTTEMAISTTTNSVNNFAKTPAAGVACARGDRLRVRIFGDDAGTMGSGSTFLISYAGVTGAADGDTFLTLTENLTFAAEPAGTQVFPTDAASVVATASNDKEAWTSRGAGVATVIVNTVAGWTAPVQWTDTAGGTVVDWFTRPLTAFTLGGAVRVNARFSATTANRPSIRCQVAIVAGDGSGAVAWASGGNAQITFASETAFSFLIGGADVAVTAGQRLRIRFSIDDSNSTAMTTGGTATLFYAGASGATGDTFLTFTQTLTESVSAAVFVPRNPGVNFQDPGVL